MDSSTAGSFAPVVQPEKLELPSPVFVSYFFLNGETSQTTVATRKWFSDSAMWNIHIQVGFMSFGV